jgi:hypothetical protein
MLMRGRKLKSKNCYALALIPALLTKQPGRLDDRSMECGGK